MNTENNVRYDIPSPLPLPYDNGSKHYRKNKPHIYLNPITIRRPKRDLSFYEEGGNEEGGSKQ